MFEGPLCHPVGVLRTHSLIGCFNRVSNLVFIKGGGGPPFRGDTRVGFGHLRRWDSAWFHHDNRIGYYCVFHGYWKTESVLKDIFNLGMSKNITGDQEEGLTSKEGEWLHYCVHPVPLLFLMTPNNVKSSSLRLSKIFSSRIAQIQINNFLSNWDLMLCLFSVCLNKISRGTTTRTFKNIPEKQGTLRWNIFQLGPQAKSSVLNT